MSKRRLKCFIPSCPNSVSKTQDKVFISVNNVVKRKWCKQLNIAYNPDQRLYCCEDHLDLNEDLDNYYQWKLMNATPRLKTTAILRYSLENKPSHEEILTESENDGVQMETRNQSSELYKMLLQPIENIPSKTYENVCTSSSLSKYAEPKQIDVATQCDTIIMKDKGTLVKKHVLKTKLVEIESTPTGSASPSHCGSTFEPDVSDATVKPNTSKESANNSRRQIINLIYKNPKMYLGLPKKYLWLIKEIEKEMSGKELDILITLFKIKLNDTMCRLADIFMLSRQTVSVSFYNGLTVLANYFQNFVFMPTPAQIKQNLPLVFKINYSNVQCILDAFEIEIEKPHDPQPQVLTWSQYKNCNTVKYLVGCTPNGFISFISKGYSGRISDKMLVEKSDLIEMLPMNAVVMADRGFKEVESLLMTKNIKLLRPPSVYATNKPTQQEVLQTKVIASLRVHIERVIRRIREFRLLKPHSVVSHKHVGYLDKIVLISCGLINLQDEIIKRY